MFETLQKVFNKYKGKREIKFLRKKIKKCSKHVSKIYFNKQKLILPPTTIPEASLLNKIQSYFAFVICLMIFMLLKFAGHQDCICHNGGKCSPVPPYDCLCNSGWTGRVGQRVKAKQLMIKLIKVILFLKQI